MAKPKATVKKAVETLHGFAMGFPEAWEDFPWGERVVKVKKKVFVFFGKPDEPIGFGVKLPESAEDALTLGYVEPAGYGLGKSGWVSVHIPENPPMDLFESWIEESYRAAAPKKLAKLLDEDAPAPKKTAKKKKRRPAR